MNAAAAYFRNAGSTLQATFKGFFAKETAGTSTEESGETAEGEPSKAGPVSASAEGEPSKAGPVSASAEGEPSQAGLVSATALAAAGKPPGQQPVENSGDS